MLESLLDMFFPPVCALCERALRDGPFCGACTEGFDAIRVKGPLCIACGAPFPGSAGPDRLCGECIKRPPPFKEARSAFYYEGPALDSIHLLKYTGRVTLASALGAMLAASAAFSAAPDVVMPVPLHRDRLRKRGFNQSLLLARVVARRLKLRLDYLNLKRERPTAPQVDLKADERKANVAGAFRLKRPSDVEGAKVLLVDDVYTTGSTIKECSKTLQKAGAEVYALTLARAKRG